MTTGSLAAIGVGWRLPIGNSHLNGATSVTRPNPSIPEREPWMRCYWIRARLRKAGLKFCFRRSFWYQAIVCRNRSGGAPSSPSRSCNWVRTGRALPDGTGTAGIGMQVSRIYPLSGGMPRWSLPPLKRHGLKAVPYQTRPPVSRVLASRVDVVPTPNARGASGASPVNHSRRSASNAGGLSFAERAG